MYKRTCYLHCSKTTPSANLRKKLRLKTVATKWNWLSVCRLFKSLCVTSRYCLCDKMPTCLFVVQFLAFLVTNPAWTRGWEQKKRRSCTTCFKHFLISFSREMPKVYKKIKWKAALTVRNLNLREGCGRAFRTTTVMRLLYILVNDRQNRNRGEKPI